MNKETKIVEENIEKQNLQLETIEDFEEVGENNFGSRIRKIYWKGILKKAGITIFVIFILFMILR